MPTIEFTDLVKDVIKSSGKLAMLYGEEYIGPEHLLLAIIDESLKQVSKSEVLLKVFKYYKTDIFELIKQIEETFDHTKPKLSLDRIPFSAQPEAILKSSYLEAKFCDSDMIDVEHLFLAYLRRENTFCKEVLAPQHKFVYEQVRRFIKSGII